MQTVNAARYQREWRCRDNNGRSLFQTHVDNPFETRNRTQTESAARKVRILAEPQATIPSSDFETSAPQAENQIKRNPTTHRRCLSRRSKATEPVESQPVAAAKQFKTTYSANLSLHINNA